VEGMNEIPVLLNQLAPIHVGSLKTQPQNSNTSVGDEILRHELSVHYCAASANELVAV
jgi:hypothetical protein